MTQDKFIEKAVSVHGDKYDYSRVEYVNSVTDVEIICAEHGEFWQKPVTHLRGSGCPICANNRRGKNRLTSEELVDKFKEVHGDRYDYSKVEYISSDEYVVIGCKEHGFFKQLPFAHLSGQGCPKCKGIGLTNDDYVKKFREIHGNKYDYSESEITKAKSKIKIICPEHGEFWKSPQKHILGQGCPECSKMRRADKRSLTYVEFVERANAVHNNEYEYIEDSYVNAHSKLDIICKKHGKFSQFAYDHLNGHGCPSCGYGKSENENEIYNYVVSLLGEEKVEKGNRSILDGKEIDIYIPSLNIGIEYNGCIWHSEKFGKDKRYHLDKTEKCLKQGVRLIHVFEDEYNNNKEIVLSKIRHLLKLDENKDKIFARNTYVKEIAKDVAKDFLNKYHIQGYGSASVNIGCYDKIDRLIGVMSFKKNKNSDWELVRFATDYNFNCIGVGGKLFKWFCVKYNPLRVKTFADRRWTLTSEENLYTKIGFKLVKTLSPDYRYVSNSDCDRVHKFNFRKTILNKKYGFSLDMTESQMCEKLEVYKVWDCGLFVYEWKKEEEV